MKVSFRLKSAGIGAVIILLLFGVYLLSTDSYTQAKFRTMQDPIETTENVDLSGLKEIQASGGPIVNFSDLKNRLKPIDKRIIVVDAIRQYHGYIDNGFFSEVPTTFLAYERHDPDLRHLLRRIFLTLSLELRKDLVVPEKVLADKYGFEYQNLKIDSRIKTPDVSVDKFVEFIDSLPKDVWLHFHCRLGKGRTSIALVMLDIMKNAPQVSLENIVKRQHLLGSENLFNIVARSGGTYYSSTLLKRKKFVEDFYAFICQRKAGGTKRWSDWRTTQKSL